GVYHHSEFQGFPSFVMWLLPFLTEMQARTAEALGCMGASWAVMQSAPELGALLMAGGLGLGVMRAFEAQANWTQVVRMRDATVLQQHNAARFRGEINEF